MCGISGIINSDGKAVKQEKIKKINDLIVHRGPDDEGFYLEKNFAFGHRRLSILDLSHDGHQPMHYLDKYTITYNGEIYNYIEVKEELVKEGYSFNSLTDTEVILASYDRWGEQCVDKFNGMWAFAIYNKEEKIIFCSRDRFGIKPFYYTQKDREFIFGSEIKQLLAFYENIYSNNIILIDYLWYGLEEHTNETFFKNIYKLEQGHNLIYDLEKDTFEIYRYYDIPIDAQLNNLTETESIDHLNNKLKNAIHLRLRSDVKVGTCLSGGLDSSSIAAIASTKYFSDTNEPFIAIHAKSIDKKTDESFFAKEVAEHCNLNLIETVPKLDDITKQIDEVIYTQEEPFGGISIFMQYFVMEKAKESGCKVMLDGQGGDETLFGYEGYLPFYFASLLKKFHFSLYFQELKKLDTFFITKKEILRSSVLVLFKNELSYLKRLFFRKKVFIKLKDNRTRHNHLYQFIDFKNFQKRDLMKRHLPQLLKYEDKNSMRHSIETRLPFVDYAFVSSAVSVNDKFKFKKGYLKYILRKMVENRLPNSITWRKNKFGFEAPEDMWIDKHKDMMLRAIKKSDILNALVEENNNLYKNNSILWKMYNISVWEKVFNVKFYKEESV